MAKPFRVSHVAKPVRVSALLTTEAAFARLGAIALITGRFAFKIKKYSTLLIILFNAIKYERIIELITRRGQPDNTRCAFNGNSDVWAGLRDQCFQ